MGSKKRKREERATIHPRNKYSGNPPDFNLLASLYPSFKPYVFYSAEGHPRIDWTDFNATRELTRVLLLHDHSLNWWIPDGQLCPTVPNRSNYIHWIEDLLSSKIIPNVGDKGDGVKGFDIGTGANCIYPLLGASLLGWCFVGSDVTDVALEWADKNVNSNPHISRLIKIRKVEDLQIELIPGQSQTYQGPPILEGVVRDGEKFDFCMCNPPFFETMEEAGLNPNTSCGGTQMEMVCPGGEQAFISRMIEDSVKLKHTFRWYTSMVGRKTNLKNLTSKLWKAGVSVVKTTEFVQGQTCRWGLAWSFLSPSKKIISHVDEKRDLSFTLQGIQRQYGAFHVLQAIELFFRSTGASCKLNVASFHVDITASVLGNEILNTTASDQYDEDKPSSSSSLNIPESELNFRISVFQQIPGTLLVKGSLQHKDSPLGGAFPSTFKQLEDNLRTKFCNHAR